MTKDLANKLITLAKEKGVTVATAESCTGGLIGAAITSVPGSSDVFGYGFITYSNDAKRKFLDVKEETLNKYGAVSKETAKEMALGGISVSGADLCVAVTGIAGPGGGSTSTIHSPSSHAWRSWKSLDQAHACMWRSGGEHRPPFEHV